jgi:hypothetical protein
VAFEVLHVYRDEGGIPTAFEVLRGITTIDQHSKMLAELRLLVFRHYLSQIRCEPFLSATDLLSSIHTHTHP